MYQSYYPYFNPYHHSTAAHTTAAETTATTTTTAASSATSAVTSPPASSPGVGVSATLTPAQHILEPSPPAGATAPAASLQLRSNSASPSPSSAHKSVRKMRIFCRYKVEKLELNLLFSPKLVLYIKNLTRRVDWHIFTLVSSMKKSTYALRCKSTFFSSKFQCRKQSFP